jgi:branched-chain amino acid transport system permease protein
MDSTIALILLKDGAVTGLIYALMGVSLVLIFSVTRIIFIPQGELVAFGGLSLAALQEGRIPGGAWLLFGLAVVAGLLDALSVSRPAERSIVGRLMAFAKTAGAGIAVSIAAMISAGKVGSEVNFALVLVLTTALGPYVYRVAFQPVADASVLLLLTTAVGVHLGLTGLALAVFGAEGYRTTSVLDGHSSLFGTGLSANSALTLVASLLAFAALTVFFGMSLTGKALRAAAASRRGARLVGISTDRAAIGAFALSSAIAGLSAILVSPTTTLYYDSGLMIGLKGFVAAIIGGLGSYPAAVVAAIAVGVAESFTAFLASAYKEVIVFACILPVLFWRSYSVGAHHDD